MRLVRQVRRVRLEPPEIPLTSPDLVVRRVGRVRRVQRDLPVQPEKKAILESRTLESLAPPEILVQPVILERHQQSRERRATLE